MALWVCLGCTAAYAVGLPRCPQCGGGDHRPDHLEEPVSSNVTSAGMFYDAGTEPPGYTDPRGADAAAPVPELPADRAPKAEWVDHAVAVAGVPPEQAEAMTKTELQETVKAAVPDNPNPPPSPPGA